MRRLLIALAAIAATAAAVLSGGPPERAAACTILPFTRVSAEDAVSRASIVAIGTWVETTTWTATLRVEDGMKGASPGQLLLVDNQAEHLGSDCKTYVRKPDRGDRFPQGERWLVLLTKKGITGLRQVGYSSFGAWPAPARDTQPLRQIGYGVPPVTLETSELRRQVLAAPLGVDLASEGRGPCSRVSVADIPEMTRQSTIVVRGRVTTAEGSIVEMDVLDWFTGGTGGRLRVNMTGVGSWWACAPNWVGPEHQQVGQEVVFFLRPDESGRADARPVNDGPFVVHVNAEYVTWGAPTTADIHAAVRVYPDPPRIEPEARVIDEPRKEMPAPGRAIEDNDTDGNRGLLWLGFGVAGVAAALTAAIFALALRNSRRARGT